MTTSNNGKPHLSSKTPVESPLITPGDLRSTRDQYIHIALLLLALSGLMCALYSLYAHSQLEKYREHYQHALLTEIDSLKQHDLETINKLDASVKSHDESKKIVDEKLATVEKAMQQRNYQINDWVFLKARYYLELAQINSHWSDNLQATEALIKQADDLLAPVHDQRLFVVRQAIAKEIAQINEISKVDITGLLGQLDAGQEIILNLPLKTSLPITTNEPYALTTATPSVPAWKDRLKKTLHSLKKLVVIRHHDQALQPPPAPEQELLLRNNLRFNLQTAQWALLQHNESVYQTALSQAIKTIEQSFDQNTASTQMLLKQLQELQKAHLIQEKPKIAQSLPLLNQIIESRKIEENPSVDDGDTPS